MYLSKWNNLEGKGIIWNFLEYSKIFQRKLIELCRIFWNGILWDFVEHAEGLDPRRLLENVLYPEISRKPLCTRNKRWNIK